MIKNTFLDNKKLNTFSKLGYLTINKLLTVEYCNELKSWLKENKIISNKTEVEAIDNNIIYCQTDLLNKNSPFNALKDNNILNNIISMLLGENPRKLYKK